MILGAISFFIGIIGTLIGAGGGFLLIPILFWLSPEDPYQHITALSMFFIACNASSGSISYFIQKKIHLRAAILFILASVPGVLLGVYMEQWVSRKSFEQIFGALLVFYAIALFVKKTFPNDSSNFHHKTILSKKKYFLGSLISLFISTISSFLGIGGGIIHVPLLVHTIGFPTHFATGTSHLILAITAWIATIEHFHYGHIIATDPTLLYLAIPGIIGAQIGASLAPRVPATVILRVLAFALILVGIRLLARNVAL